MIIYYNKKMKTSSCISVNSYVSDDVRFDAIQKSLGAVVGRAVEHAEYQCPLWFPAFGPVNIIENLGELYGDIKAFAARR